MCGQSKLAVYRAMDCGVLLHTWAPDSCVRALYMFWKAVFFNALKLYGPLFLTPALFKFRARWIEMLQSVVPNTVRSSTFLSVYAGSVLAFACAFRQVVGQNFLLSNGFLPCFFSSWALFIERKSRRAELGMYVSTQALWCLWRKAVQLGWVKNLPHGEVWLFSLSMAVLMRAHCSPNRPKNAVQSLLSFLLQSGKTLDGDIDHESGHVRLEAGVHSHDGERHEGDHGRDDHRPRTHAAESGRDGQSTEITRRGNAQGGDERGAAGEERNGHNATLGGESTHYTTAAAVPASSTTLLGEYPAAPTYISNGVSAPSMGSAGARGSSSAPLGGQANSAGPLPLHTSHHHHHHHHHHRDHFDPLTGNQQQPQQPQQDGREQQQQQQQHQHSAHQPHSLHHPPKPMLRGTALLLRILRAVLRSFGVGAVIKILMTLPSVVRKRSLRPLLHLKQYGLAACLGGFTALFHSTNTALREMGCSLQLRSTIAGLIGGLSFAFYRSTGIAVYALAKALEVLFWGAVSRGWLRSFHHGDVLLYASGVSVLLHFAIIDPAVLPRAYYVFANSVSNGIFNMVNRKVYIGLGCGSEVLL